MKHYVSICTKNRESDVTKLLLSISKSELPSDLSIVIADSTHPIGRFDMASKKYLNEFPGLDISHFYHEGGLPSARNACLNQIDGSGIIHFFDDDVEIAPNFFSVVEEFFYQAPDAVGCGPKIRGLYLESSKRYQIIENQGKLLPNGRNFWVRDDLDNNLKVSWIPGCAMSFQLDAIRDIQFNFSLEGGPGKNYALGEDLDFTHRLSAKGNLYALSGTYVHHNYATSKRDDLQLMSYASGKFMIQLKRLFGREISIPRSLVWKYLEIFLLNSGRNGVDFKNLVTCLILFSRGLIEEIFNPVLDISKGSR